MSPFLRKVTLTTHLASSLGWLGAVAAYLAVAISGLTADSLGTVKAAYPSMALIGWFVIVPLCLAALLTGVVHALGTPWCLFRHYWVVAKLVLVVIATIILLAHLPAVSRMAEVAAGALALDQHLGMSRLQFVVHAAGGAGVLLLVTTISVFKPWGRTSYGRRMAATG